MRIPGVLLTLAISKFLISVLETEFGLVADLTKEKELDVWKALIRQRNSQMRKQRSFSLICL
jgi:hypothetical protein